MAGQANDSDALGESEIFHLLGNDRRRAIIRTLREQGEPSEVSTIATRVAEAETDEPSVPDGLYKSVYVSLQQTHFPLLEENAVVVYDTTEKTVERGPRFAEVVTYVDADCDSSSAVHAGHLGICALALSVVAVDLLAPLTIGAVFVSTAALLAVAVSSLYRLLA